MGDARVMAAFKETFPKAAITPSSSYKALGGSSALLIKFKLALPDSADLQPCEILSLDTAEAMSAFLAGDQDIIKAFQKTFPGQNISTRSSFSGLGGSSGLLIKFTLELPEKMKLQPTDILDLDTVGAMSAFVKTGQRVIPCCEEDPFDALVKCFGSMFKCIA
jgi:hypothetical protein